MSVIVSIRPNVWQVSSNSEVIKLDDYLWVYLSKIPVLTESGAIDLTQPDSQWNYQDRFELISNRWEPKKWFLKKMLEEKAKRVACSIYDIYVNNNVIHGTSPIDAAYYENLEKIFNDVTADAEWEAQITSEAIASSYTGATAAKDYATAEFGQVLSERNNMKLIQLHIRGNVFTLYKQINEMSTTAEGWTIDASIEAWQANIQTYVDSL